MLFAEGWFEGSLPAVRPIFNMLNPPTYRCLTNEKTTVEKKQPKKM